MIYLTPTTDPQLVCIPRNIGINPPLNYVLELRSTVDRSRITISPKRVTECALDYTACVVLPPDMTPGEYEYELRKGAVLLASGLAVVGNYEQDLTQYNPVNAYKQYGAE